VEPPGAVSVGIVDIVEFHGAHLLSKNIFYHRGGGSSRRISLTQPAAADTMDPAIIRRIFPMANEELLNEEEISILSLTDEEGNEVEFELIDSVDFEGKEYLILLPPEEEASEVVILEVEPHKDGSESYLTVDDERVLNEVFAVFKERFAEFFTFEE
jgi:uncharacterized protein YrzB (UPF0473 family)